MNYKEYRDYLKNDHWNNVKKKYWQSSLPKNCRICGCLKNLQLHHRTYNCLYREMITVHVHLLCGDCHRELHFGEGKTPLTWKDLTMRLTFLRKKYGKVNIHGFVKKSASAHDYKSAEGVLLVSKLR